MSRTKSQRRDLKLPWGQLLKQLPATANYLKLFVAQRSYEYCNARDMEAVWRELGPVIGIKGTARVDGLQFGLGYNTSVALKAGEDAAQAKLSEAYQKRYQIQCDAVRSGQGTVEEVFNFSISGDFPTASEISSSTSDELVSILAEEKAHIQLTYEAFRQRYPKSAASLYRRHLLKQVEPKIKAAHTAAVEELKAWEEGASDFNLTTKVNGTMPVKVAVFVQDAFHPCFDDSEEGQQWKDKVAQANSHIKSLLQSFVEEGKAFSKRSHYVTAQNMAKVPVKKQAATKPKATKPKATAAAVA